MTITEAQYQEMLARCERNRGRTEPVPEDAVERESDLHDDIIALCKTNGWYYVHSRRDKATTNAVGTPDFIIAAEPKRWMCPGCERIIHTSNCEHGDGCCGLPYQPIARTFWIECKRKGGKPTTEQLATIAMLRKLGHTAEFVRSIGEVCQLIAKNET